MPAELFALANALFIALHYVFRKKGLKFSNPPTAVLTSLDLGEVVVVIPVSSTGPLFSLALTALFLKDVERVTVKIVLGAVFIISGVILITLWK
jgi:uncharacterized membrane protein